MENEIVKKKHYLIDYENVNHSGFIGIEKLTENDVVTIFYTQNANTMPFTLHLSLIACPAEVNIIKADDSSKNALDFQLSSYLGFLLGQDRKLDVHIISKDKGYECLRNFWKNHGHKIKISADIAGNVPQMLPAVIEPDAQFMSAISGLNLNKTDRQKFYNIFTSNSKIKDIPKRKQTISNEITKAFGNNKTKVYYKAIKPLIK